MSTKPRTPAQAIAYAKARAAEPARPSWHAMCLMFVRFCYDLPAVYGKARTAWEGAKHRHATTNAANIPAGVPVFWRTGTVNWHIAISIGDGYCYSTDIGGKGKVGRIGINDLSKRWGATLLGWTEDLNGFRVYTPPAKPKPPAKKSVAQLAGEVIAGKWGNGADRRKRLTAAGHDYTAVQAEVNRRLRR